MQQPQLPGGHLARIYRESIRCQGHPILTSHSSCNFHISTKVKFFQLPVYLPQSDRIVLMVRRHNSNSSHNNEAQVLPLVKNDHSSSTMRPKYTRTPRRTQRCYVAVQATKRKQLCNLRLAGRIQERKMLIFMQEKTRIQGKIQTVLNLRSLRRTCQALVISLIQVTRDKNLQGKSITQAQTLQQITICFTHRPRPMSKNLTA